jgi:3,4-dihydroxy 2-butanone 4-phosphate synthase/GTP cyclohydrolase II
MIDPETRPEELGKPGHIFPLRARKGGVLRRAGHTEAAVDLSRMAGFEEAGIIVEILNEDGSMARLPQLIEIAKRFDLKIVSIEDLIKYRIKNETHIEHVVDVNLPTEIGDFQLHAFKDLNSDMDHLALVKGTWGKDEPVLVRVHSSCMTGDIFGSCRCDCGPQLHKAMELIEKEGKGAIVYMNQEGRGIGLLNKLKAYKLQEQGRDTVEANLELGFKMDERDYGVGAQIIRDLGISKMKLISNNPVKRVGLIGYGLEVVENVPIIIQSNPHNEKYMQTKKDKMGHSF